MRSADTYHTYMNQEMCSAYLLQNLKRCGFLRNLVVNYIQHDVTEMRCKVVIGTEMYKVSRLNWLSFVKKIMEDLGRYHGQKFSLHVYEWRWQLHINCWNSKHPIYVPVTVLSPRRLGFDLRAVRVWFVVDKVPLMQISLLLLQLCSVIVFPPILHYLISFTYYRRYMILAIDSVVK
jgi:hypothetical protein